MKKFGIIMAGGSGERFWPLSRKHHPKQLLKLNSEKYSMLEETLDRISPLIPVEDIFIATNTLLVDAIRECLPNVPPNNVIPEPAKQNTAPCLALAAAYISARYPGEEISIAVLTTDQNIQPANKFLQCVNAAMEFATKNKQLVIIGVPPTSPDTGFGYIETKNQFATNDNIEFQPVIRFREKPNLQQAQEFINTGRFTWNSGMFFWNLNTFVSEMLKHTPEIGKSIAQFGALLKDKTHIAYKTLDDAIVQIYLSLPKISIDYALMEKTKNVSVCKAIFDWDDIGAWDSLDRTKQKDANGNVLNGKLSAIDCKKSIIINESKDKKVILAGLGLEDIVVITTDDAVLVCPKSQVQNIKSVVEDIRGKYGEDVL